MFKRPALQGGPHLYLILCEPLVDFSWCSVTTEPSSQLHLYDKEVSSVCSCCYLIQVFESYCMQSVPLRPPSCVECEFVVSQITILIISSFM